MQVENVKNTGAVQACQEVQTQPPGMVFGYVAMTIAVIAWSLFAISIRAIEGVRNFV